MTKLEAAAHWEKVASDLDAMADHEDNLGQPYGSTETKRRNAELYRTTAQVLRKEAETGLPHCMYCLKDHPTSDHVRHV